MDLDELERTGGKGVTKVTSCCLLKGNRSHDGHLGAVESDWGLDPVSGEMVAGWRDHYGFFLPHRRKINDTYNGE